MCVSLRKFNYVRGVQSGVARILSKRIMILYIPQDSISPLTRALVLAIGVCYHAKLQERREEYRTVVARSFKAPCLLPGGQKQIHREISRYEESLIQRGLLHAKEFMTEPIWPFTYPNRKTFIAASQLIVVKSIFCKGKESLIHMYAVLTKVWLTRKQLWSSGFLLTPLVVLYHM